MSELTRSEKREILRRMVRRKLREQEDTDTSDTAKRVRQRIRKRMIERYRQENGESRNSLTKEDIKERFETLSLTRGLLPKDLETHEYTNQELLARAVGNEVEDPQSRSEDYLKAKLEGIVERRKQAAGQFEPSSIVSRHESSITRPISILDIKKRYQNNSGGN